MNQHLSYFTSAEVPGQGAHEASPLQMIYLIAQIWMITSHECLYLAGEGVLLRGRDSFYRLRRNLCDFSQAGASEAAQLCLGMQFSHSRSKKYRNVKKKKNISV